MPGILTEERAALEVIYRRRAVRSYKRGVLEERRVRALLDAAVHAPTAMDQEPWEFVVVQDVALLRRLSDFAKEMVKADAHGRGNELKPPGAAGDGIASLMADHRFDIFYDASTLVVICAKPVNEFVTADCWLAAENLMLAACAEGLGTCCIGFAVPALNRPDIKAELGIPADVRAFAPIIIGVPQHEVIPPVARKPAVVLNWIR